MNTLTPQSTPPPSMSSPMTPLQLSGFLSGDTIQVQGDTGDLRFSVRLDVVNKRKTLFPDDKPVPSSSPPPPEDLLFSDQDSASSSPYHRYATPIASREASSCETAKEEVMTITTRLRSGALSPVVSYFPRVSLGNTPPRRRRRNGNKTAGSVEGGALERSWRRRSFPVRPCSSYAFFVMATWGRVKASSFGETSKRVGQLWFKLPSNKKKLYEEMAAKDNERYKWQAELFMNHDHEQKQEEEQV